jgi:hypothetical protein
MALPEPGRNCLTPAEAQRFLRGQMRAAEAREVSGHADECPTCDALIRETLREITGRADRCPSIETILDVVAGRATGLIPSAVHVHARACEKCRDAVEVLERMRDRCVIHRPEPGIYPDVDMDTYHALDAASNSRLVRLAKSPAHLRAHIEEPRKETAALAIGHAIHHAILEPDIFAERYRKFSGADRRTKAGKDEWAALEAEAGAGYVLRPDDWEVCIRSRDAVHGNRAAAKMLTGNGRTELTCVWKDGRTGVTCKGRLDRHSPDLPGGAIVDLKTARDASPREFERSIFQYRYFQQAAMYLEGAHALGIDIEHYVIVAVEKTPPYGVAVYRLTEPVIDEGRKLLRPLLELYERLEEIPMAQWPCYPEIVTDIAIPNWGWRQIAEVAAQLQEEAA